MKKPIIFSVDDDPQVLRAISKDLRSQYKNEFRIIRTPSAKEALETLVEFKKKGEVVALFLSDQRMPEMEGVDFLEAAKEIYPEAKRVLLTAYSDTDAAIKAINEVGLDYYLMKPWDPPEEKLYPTLDDLLDDWAAGYQPDFDGIKVIGYNYSPSSHHIKDYLAGNLYPYQWLDVQTNEKAKDFLHLHNLEEKDSPVVIFEDGSALAQPSLTAIAEKIGRQPQASEDLYDVVIVGAGPAGLAAAVYGGSEGLKTLLIEKRAPGGQAGTSSRIENYLGFPKGLSGADLSRRAITQATRFGVEFLSPQTVVKIEHQSPYKKIHLADGSHINTKAVVITTGVDYRKLETKGVPDFTGAGVYYGAATTEANSCSNKQVYIVGGGNSAGQGAVYLSRFAKDVHILIRRPDLSSSMSSYLIDQINEIDNIKVMGHTEIQEAFGDDRLRKLSIRNNEQQEVNEVDADSLFIFIGAKPYTGWLNEHLLLDQKGFILTGSLLEQTEAFKKVWKYHRPPFVLETCVPGIFAAGDVRSGAMARVASAVGEGSMAISFVHRYLAEL